MATDTISAIETKLNKATAAVVPSTSCCLAAKKLTTNDEAYKSLAEGLDVYIIKPDEKSKRTEKYRRCGRSVYGDGNEPLCWKHWEVRDNAGFKYFKDVASNPSAVKASIKDFEGKAKKKDTVKTTKYNAKKLEAQPAKEVVTLVIKKTPEITAVFQQIQKWLDDPSAFTISPVKAIDEPSEESASISVDNQEEEVAPVPVEEPVVASQVDESEVLSDISVEDNMSVSNDLELDDELDLDDEEETEDVSMDCLTTVDNVDYGYVEAENEVWLVGDNGEGEQVGSLEETNDKQAAIHKDGKYYFICEEKRVIHKGAELMKCFHTSRCYKNGKYIGKMENGVMTK